MAIASDIERIELVIRETLAGWLTKSDSALPSGVPTAS